MTPGLWRSLGDRAQVWPGRNWPLGATWTAESTNFAVYAPDATEVWLCLFDDEDESGGERRFPLTEHSLGIWHGALPDIEPGTRYGYRVHGPWDPSNGMRFNPKQLLLDPYGLAVSGTAKAGPENLAYDVDDPSQPSSIDSAPATARSIVVDPSFDWEGDTLPKHRWRDTVIYELHVKGFTKLHDRIPEELRGTYAGLGHPGRDRLPRRPGRHRDRAAAGAPVLLGAGAARARTDATTGATTASASSLRTPTTARRATAASRSPSSRRW